MPAIETSIWMALRSGVETLALTPAPAIIWPGESETLPHGTALEILHFPNTTERVFIASTGPQQYRGILQLGLLTVPGAENHETVVREIAGKIVAHFPVDQRLRFDGLSVRITKRPNTSRGFRDEKRNRWMTLISVNYECFA